MKRTRRRFTLASANTRTLSLVVMAGALLVFLIGGVLWSAQESIPSAGEPRTANPPSIGKTDVPVTTALRVRPQKTLGEEPHPPGQEQSAGEPTKAKSGRPGWKLVWSDEFNKDGAPDTTKWVYEVGFVRNRELQYYTKDRRENARIERGCLIIEGRKERYRNSKYKPGAKGNWKAEREFAEYTSACLTTKGKASWTYGRIEVCAKLPTGRGTWPAIWMLGANKKVGWPKCGEIDIMEYVGFNPNVIHTTVHTGKYNHVKRTQKGGKTKLKDPHKAFHLYAIEWDAKKIDFFVDDQKVFTFEDDGGGEDAWPFNHDHYLLLNLAIGGAWGGAKGVDGSIWPQKYYIDYVRVYQRP